jgi:DNA-directed RNA polymerase specialized sigma24 family protein
MAEETVVDLYLKMCELLSLNEGERRRFWFALATEVARVEAALPDPLNADAGAVNDACERLRILPIGELAAHAKRPVFARTKQSRAGRNEPWSNDPREVAVLYWDMVEDLVYRSRSRWKADEEEADAVESMVKVKLLEDDCRIIRDFRHESSFAHYLNTIVQWTFSDLFTRRFGKWHYSAAAERLGPIARKLEKAIVRDGYTQDEAVSMTLSSHPDLSRRQLEDMLAQLPARQARPMKVSLDEVPEPEHAAQADERAINGERLRLSGKVLATINEFMERLETTDRLLLQFLFDEGLKISSIAVMLQREQKSLYRRRDQLFTQLRKDLDDAGITREDAMEFYQYVAEESTDSVKKKR